MSQVLSVAPRTDTPCRPWTSHYIGAVSANLKNSLYVTKETSIILFQLGAVDILTFSPLNVNWTFRSDPSHPFIFIGYRNDRFFPFKNPYIFECHATMPMIADAHVSSLRHATLLAPAEVRCVATWARHTYNGCAADPGGGGEVL